MNYDLYSACHLSYTDIFVLVLPAMQLARVQKRIADRKIKLEFNGTRREFKLDFADCDHLLSSCKKRRMPPIMY